MRYVRNSHDCYCIARLRIVKVVSGCSQFEAPASKPYMTESSGKGNFFKIPASWHLRVTSLSQCLFLRVLSFTPSQVEYSIVLIL